MAESAISIPDVEEVSGPKRTERAFTEWRSGEWNLKLFHGFWVTLFRVTRLHTLSIGIFYLGNGKCINCCVHISKATGGFLIKSSIIFNVAPVQFCLFIFVQELSEILCNCFVPRK